MTDSILAYTFEADVHCASCAVARFGQQPGKSWVREDAEDAEGNPVRPVFAWEDWPRGLEACGTCGARLCMACGATWEDRAPECWNCRTWHGPYIAADLIVAGAVDESRTFEGSGAEEELEDWLEEVREDSRGSDAGRFEVFVLRHLHPLWEDDECTCAQYLTDHHPAAVFADGVEVEAS